MPEWLDHAAVTPPVALPTMAVRIAIALVLGAVVAAVYRFSHGGRARDAATLSATIVLLAGLLAMVSMVIGDSVARAFGLVGALSIVRFRTVVEDTRDTAFVIFAVIVGMAVGTGLIMVAAVGVPLVGLAAIALSAGTPAVAARTRRFTVTVRTGLGRDPSALNPVIAERARILRTTAAKTARQGSAIDLSMLVETTDDQIPPLLLSLNAVEGVQEVEIEPAAD
jgi:hypothetical protein